jgi:hypothetical protein
VEQGLVEAGAWAIDALAALLSSTGAEGGIAAKTITSIADAGLPQAFGDALLALALPTGAFVSALPSLPTGACVSALPSLKEAVDGGASVVQAFNGATYDALVSLPAFCPFFFVPHLFLSFSVEKGDGTHLRVLSV